MNLKSLITGLTLACAPFIASAADETPFINLTPAPVEMTAGEGEFALTAGLTVGGPGLTAEMNTEIDRFITRLNAATGLAATRTDAGNATMLVQILDGAAPGFYTLNVTTDGVKIGAGSDLGLYYAFQTLRKILPANVMAEVFEQKEYALPEVSISDSPRMEYRGFMLDVSRHFFTVAEVKRMLDVMSYYKMNKFHWHLTDDQGWRIEMPQYPRLTTIGATAPNCEIVDMYTKTDYWLNKPYGPYFYTQDELREVVAYAAERHIDIIPEVEMPGHFSAVMAAYPEFSLNPDGGHSVAVTGGVYGDVMNLANPAAIKFAEDVIDVLADIFPSEIIHIGGDECPDGGWVKVNDKGLVTGGNAECVAMYNRENCTHPRQLQSIFTKHMADYAATKGRKIGVWNESISSAGTNEDLIKQTDATVWCWTGADGAVNKATNLGLKAIYTPISKTGDTKGSFYINRSQDPNDPPANGYKCDDVKSVYATIPFTTQALRNHPELCYGVQGTFWCERVAYREYLEYLALPRLLAIAEIGWTPEAGKNWESFQKRMSADRELLDYNDYKYSPYHMLDTGTTPPTPGELTVAPFEQGADYVFTSAAPNFAGAMLSDNGSSQLVHSTSQWANTVWTVSSAASNADGSQTITLTNALTGKTISTVGDASGRIAKPVNLGASAAELKAYRYDADTEAFKLAIGADDLWSIPSDAATAAGTMRAGETKNGGGVSPFQGAAWTARKVEIHTYVAHDADGNTLFTGKCGVSDNDFEASVPTVPNHRFISLEQAEDGTVNCLYQRTERTVTYIGRLENGAYVYITEESVPADMTSLPEPNIPGAPGFTLTQAGTPVLDAETGNFTVESTYATDAHIGSARPIDKLTEIEAGKAYLIRDAHVDRHAFRCATSAGTVNGAKSANGVSPMFTWILEPKNSGFMVRNLATDQYILVLQRSTTAKLGANGHAFTFTYDTDHWTVKGTNGMYWDGLDNLDLVGWNQGTGHPVEVYTFMATPFFAVTVNSVDAEGTLLGSEVKYAPAGEPFVLGMPYRKGYTITAVEGAEQLKNLTADANVTIVYTSDVQLSISEINAADSASASATYDLLGRRVISPRHGIYIQSGRKLIIR